MKIRSIADEILARCQRHLLWPSSHPGPISLGRLDLSCTCQYCLKILSLETPSVTIRKPLVLPATATLMIIQGELVW
jgi:hypothetical protein